MNRVTVDMAALEHIISALPGVVGMSIVNINRQHVSATGSA